MRGSRWVAVGWLLLVASACATVLVVAGGINLDPDDRSQQEYAAEAVAQQRFLVLALLLPVAAGLACVTAIARARRAPIPTVLAALGVAAAAALVAVSLVVGERSIDEAHRLSLDPSIHRAG